MRSTLLWAVVVLLVNAVTVRCIPFRELDSMFDTLRTRGYDLFCNAIVTSDLQVDLLSIDDANDTHSFTFFAPTDASLFALDMTQTASSYTDTLRYHIIPRRLSLAELRLLPDGYMLPTLLSTRRLRVTRRPHSSVTTVGGVDVAFHGLFYGRHVAVHGLAGILSLRSNNPPPPPAPLHPPTRSADHRHFSPRNSPVMPENQTVRGQVPRTVTFNITGWRGSRRPAAAPAPAPESVQAPENGRVDAPEPESDWTVHPPVNLNNAPSITPFPSDPESTISLPPEGYSETTAPAAVGLKLLVRQKNRVWLMETEGETETLEKSEPLDGVRNCEKVTVGLRDHVSDGDNRYMQCNAA